MKIAIAQLNTSVGNIEGNSLKIIEYSKLAKSSGAELMVCPELTITGYPPQDLLLKSHFIKEQYDAALYVAKNVELPTIFGFVDVDSRYKDKIHNAAGLAIGQNLIHVSHKMLLPNYDVFDERRYFTPGKSNSPIRFNDKTLGIIICEDMWEDAYNTTVIGSLKDAGANLIIDISASPWHRGKLSTRVSVAQMRTSKYGLPILYCNQVGGQDEIIFDGQSFYMSHNGYIRNIMPKFKEQLAVIDTDVVSSAIFPCEVPEDTFQALVLGTRDYAAKTGFNSFLLGLSGGIDSTLVAAIAKETGFDVLGVSLPSHVTSDDSRNEAKDYAERLGIGFTEVPIRDAFDAITKTYEGVFNQKVSGIPRENIQPRIRGLYLMLLSNMTGRLLLSTGNKTEIALGYSTLYGDMCGGLDVIGDLEKTSVYDLCSWYNIMKGKEVISNFVLSRPPTAELETGQQDPFDYPLVSKIVDDAIVKNLPKDEIYRRYMTKDNAAELKGTIDDAFRRIKISQFKRFQSPPILKVSSKAFGFGRRMPIANQYDF